MTSMNEQDLKEKGGPDADKSASLAKNALACLVYISVQEVHLHGEIGPPSRQKKSTVTEKKSSLYENLLKSW